MRTQQGRHTPTRRFIQSGLLLLPGLLPPRLGARLDKIEPFGLFIVAGLVLLPMFQPMLRLLLSPAFHAMGHFIGALIGSAA